MFIVSLLVMIISQAFGIPTQMLCESPLQDSCTNPATFGLNENDSLKSILPTDAQLEPLMKWHRQSSWRAKKVIVNPIDSLDALDWLVKLGQENEAILIGEEHYLAVTQSVELEMIKVLIERAEYRQVVIELPYSITPLLNAYVNIDSDEEAFDFFNQHLVEHLYFPTSMMILNTIRQHNRSHTEHSVQLLATDVEHATFLKFDTASDSFIAELKEEYSALSESQFPEDERERFYAQALRNFDDTIAYYEMNNIMDKFRQDRIEANLTGLYGLTQKAILIGGSLHFKLGPACEEGQLGEGCFLDLEHPTTRGRVANIRFKTLGYYLNPSMGEATLEACNGSVIGETAWASIQKKWLENFSKWGDVVYVWQSYWTPVEKALRWHGREHQAKPFRIEEINPSLRKSRSWAFSEQWFSHYDEIVIVPLDTWVTPFCALMDK